MTKNKFQLKREFLNKNPHCIYCKTKLTWETASMDHKIPSSKHGKGGDNFALSCKPCNLLKGSTISFVTFSKMVTNEDIRNFYLEKRNEMEEQYDRENRDLLKNIEAISKQYDETSALIKTLIPVFGEGSTKIRTMKKKLSNIYGNMSGLRRVKHTHIEKELFKFMREHHKETAID